ncbi:MAG: polyketide synthase, partial [Myxococcota bacterium]
CVLPGAFDAKELWTAVANGRCLLTKADPKQDWGLTTPVSDAELATAVGGYVRGFDAVFDPHAHENASKFASRASDLFRWVLFCVRRALCDASIDPASKHARGGLVLGNLSYPTREFAEFVIDVWSKGTSTADPRERFMSGLPALLAAETFGLELGGMALDAACASSLYAIKMACDRLHDGEADFMVAGGVNHADDLYLHLGFTALKALSPTGRSRPFHRDADGLIPAHGAAVVVLKRLADAVRHGDSIHGVIRGVGLSNDGRSSGLLNPSSEGQVRAMRQAYANSGVDPADVAYVECHATGTRVGDAVELRSMKSVFEQGVAVGSLKSNLGHLITASGAAGLLKVLQGMAHGQWPATLHVDAPSAELDDGQLRVVRTLEPWTGPRRAAINNFGFGGNNAHLIVEAYDGVEPRPQPRSS